MSHTDSPPSEEDLWSRLGEADGRERVELLIELGNRAGSRGDLSAAASLFETAGTESAAMQDETLAGESFCSQGAALFGTGDYEDSSRAYGMSAKHYLDAGRGGEVADVLWRQGDAFHRLGRWQDMLDAASAALPFARAEDEGELSGRICLQRAKALYRLDQDEAALADCGVGRDYFRKAGVSDGVAAIDDFALTICLWLGRLDQALELATSCHVLAMSSSRTQDDTEAELRLAETYVARDEFELALLFADRAMQRSKDSDDRVGIARGCVWRARALEGLDRDDEAVDVYIEARVLFDANGFDRDASFCEIRRAQCLHYLRRYDEAAAANTRLAEVFTASQDWLGVAYSIHRLADNYVHSGDLQAAIDAVDGWLGTGALDDPAVRVPAIKVLACKAIAMLELGDSEGAHLVAEHALAMTSEADVDPFTALIFEVRARYLLEQGDADARQELAHAIALHLAVGWTDRARELSRHFMPEIRAQSREKSDSSVPEPSH